MNEIEIIKFLLEKDNKSHKRLHIETRGGIPTYIKFSLSQPQGSNSEYSVYIIIILLLS